MGMNITIEIRQVGAYRLNCAPLDRIRVDRIRRCCATTICVEYHAKATRKAVIAVVHIAVLRQLGYQICTAAIVPQSRVFVIECAVTRRAVEFDIHRLCDK
jgi:hypothetical protein